MNTTPDPHDTILDEEARLTAFVLGELDEAETTAFAARVDQDAALRREVEAIRRTVEVVTADLNRETAPGLTPE